MSDAARPIVAARQCDHIYISPDGTAHDTRRIGERRNGVVISSAEMSDDEIKAVGLTGRVNPASADANRLYEKRAGMLG